MSFYGACPRCGADGKSRERRINGNDICAAGHVYPSRDAIHPKQAAARRDEVYAAIDSERYYQDKRWGSAGCNHEIAAWLTYMQSYLQEAINLASHNSPETVALDCIRKVTAMGVRCMEEHGAPPRRVD